MNPQTRRSFIKTSLAATAVGALARPGSAAEPVGLPQGRDLYELRAYRLKPGASSELLEGYLAKAFIPALNARGIPEIGVFKEIEPKEGPVVWVLIPHPSLESVVQVTAAINLDPDVRAAGADYLNSPTKENPAFERIDSWLLLAFTGHPRVAVPSQALAGKPRIYELRTYDSFSEAKALGKVTMFNSGEIPLMQQLGLSPVFYGQALVGRGLPELTYMLSGPDLETHKANWNAFLAHPTWLQLKNDPKYADTVSKVTSRFLAPLPVSQI